MRKHLTLNTSNGIIRHHTEIAFISLDDFTQILHNKQWPIIISTSQKKTLMNYLNRIWPGKVSNDLNKIKENYYDKSEIHKVPEFQTNEEKNDYYAQQVAAMFESKDTVNQRIYFLLIKS